MFYFVVLLNVIFLCLLFVCFLEELCVAIVKMVTQSCVALPQDRMKPNLLTVFSIFFNSIPTSVVWFIIQFKTIFCARVIDTMRQCSC